jgi:hypothetical protein
MGGVGAGALAGAAVAGSSSEMRQTYGEDDATGYRGWGPTSSNNKRSNWVSGAGSADAGAAAAGAAAVGAGAYYDHQRGNGAGGYEPYPQQSGGEYYYPDDHVEEDGAPPALPQKSYDRYDPALAGGYTGAPTAEYNHDESGALGVVNTDVQRQPSNASSRYSTVSTDENAGRSYQNSPRFPQGAGFQNPAGTVGGRPGRSTMGATGGYDDDENGGRYDAVNF